MTLVQRKKDLKRKREFALLFGLIFLLVVLKATSLNKEMEPESTQENVVVETETESGTEVVAIEPVKEEVVMVASETETEVETETETESETKRDLSFIDDDIEVLCFEVGEEYGIAPELLIAIIERESGGDVYAKNEETGCMGLMQLYPKYANHYLRKAGCSDPYNPEHNIKAGCEILIEKFNTDEDLPLVLMKYHGESDAYSNYKNGKYSPYCKGIMKRMEEMQGE